MKNSSKTSKRKAFSSLVEEGRRLLEESWNNAESFQEVRLPSRIKQNIESVFESKFVKSFRYALITQIVAKLVATDIDIFSIQAKDEPISKEKKSFDARTFCKNVVVWFERKHLHNLLGRSSDPYVSKPLRKSRLYISDSSIKDPTALRTLIEILTYTEEQIECGKHENAFAVLYYILCVLKRRLEMNLEPPSGLEDKEIPPGVLTGIVKKFQEGSSSLGSKPQYTIYSLLIAFNNIARIYNCIKMKSATTSDSSSGSKADIEVYDKEGKLKIAISITDRLSKEKLESESIKARNAGIKELMIIANVISDEVESVDPQVYFPLYYKHYSISEYLQMMVWSINADVRTRFVKEMYNTLKKYGEIDNLRLWHQLVIQYICPEV